MDPWQAEHGVDAELARRLIAAAWPDLAGDVTRVGSGWDTDVWRVGELAVRFPRRAFGVACVDNELVVLPRLPALPIAIPRPLRVGEPMLGYPSRFYAHAWLPGAPVLRTQPSDDELARLATPLGELLRVLHATPPPAGVPADRRRDVVERGHHWLAQVAAVVAPAIADAARALLAAMPAPDAAPVLLHNDLHAANLLVDAGAPTGVIDWGDSAVGEPASDLAVGWSVVPPGARAAFRAAYGPISDATWARARVVAVVRQGLVFAAWGRDDPGVAAWTARSLARILD